MKVRASVLALMVCLGLMPLTGRAESELSADQQAQLAQALGPRPEIRDYDRQDQFVTDLLAWQRRKTELENRLARGQAITTPPPATPRDWHHVTGPEDLDTALQNAEGYQQPEYQEPLRYDRTTHLSFPLAPLPQQQLSDKALSAPQLPPAPVGQEEIPESILEDNARIQRELSASQADAPPPELYREHFVSHSRLQ
ncbi:MAG: hypothetical protein MI745_14435 [Pseudomonadales bacterium]|nr:hypothetical protein [Pseudomonadales bacterium]